MKNKIPISLTLLSFLYLNFMFQNAHAQSYTLYGITQFGGTYNEGVLYRYEYPSGNDTILVNFNDTNGSIPRGALMMATDGNLYGTTTKGGTYNDGVLFRLNPKTFKDTVLTNFNGINGSHMFGGVMQASNGLLYGLTSAGGANNLGVCFSYNINTLTQTTLFSFDGTNGSVGIGCFVQISNGFLIAHTNLGGAYGYGTVFYYNINTNNDSILINFADTNGAQPKGLMQASNGLLYGTTIIGGSNNYGVFYSYDLTSKAYSVLFNFNGTNGIYPCGDPYSLVEDTNGLIYGIVQMGGTYNNGLLYSYNVNTNKDSVLINLTPNDTLGNDSYTEGFIKIAGGILLTPMDSAGAFGYGTLVSYNPANGKLKKLLDFDGTNGAYPSADLVAVPDNSEEGIEGIKNNVVVSLFPNPNHGVFTLQQTAVKGQLIVEIYNMLGENIFSETLAYNKEGNIINLSSQPKGIYLYRLTSEDGSVVSSGKFIVE